MNTQQAAAIAAKYFPNYPKVSEFFVTKDGQVFETNNDAINHAKTLVKEKGEDAVVFDVKRDEATKGSTLDKAKELLEKVQEKLKAAEGKLAAATTGAQIKKAQELVDKLKAEVANSEKGLEEIEE